MKVESFSTPSNSVQELSFSRPLAKSHTRNPSPTPTTNRVTYLYVLIIICSVFIVLHWQCEHHLSTLYKNAKCTHKLRSIVSSTPLKIRRYFYSECVPWNWTGLWTVYYENVRMPFKYKNTFVCQKPNEWVTQKAFNTVSASSFIFKHYFLANYLRKIDSDDHRW